MNIQFERYRGHDETIIVKVMDKTWIVVTLKNRFKSRTKSNFPTCNSRLVS